MEKSDADMRGTVQQSDVVRIFVFELFQSDVQLIVDLDQSFGRFIDFRSGERQVQTVFVTVEQGDAQFIIHLLNGPAESLRRYVEQGCCFGQRSFCHQANQIIVIFKLHGLSLL